MHFPFAALLLAAAALPATAAAASTAAALPASPAASMSSPHGMTELPTGAALRHRPKVVEHYVDINSAGRAELMTLPGIGRAEADRIIAHRPYLSKTELVTKQVLLTGPFLSVRHLVVAMQKFKPKGKT